MFSGSITAPISYFRNKIMLLIIDTVDSSICGVIGALSSQPICDWSKGDDSAPSDTFMTLIIYLLYKISSTSAI
jgi:hypothetical protein